MSEWGFVQWGYVQWGYVRVGFCPGFVETDITSTGSSITTVVYMLRYRTGLISCIMSSIVFGLSATFTISHLALHVVADMDHLACHLGTPRTAGQSSVRFIRCRGVRYWAT